MFGRSCSSLCKTVPRKRGSGIEADCGDDDGTGRAALGVVAEVVAGVDVEQEDGGGAEFRRVETRRAAGGLVVLGVGGGQGQPLDL